MCALLLCNSQRLFSTQLHCNKTHHHWQCIKPDANIHVYMFAFNTINNVCTATLHAINDNAVKKIANSKTYFIHCIYTTCPCKTLIITCTCTCNY